MNDHEQFSQLCELLTQTIKSMEARLAATEKESQRREEAIKEREDGLKSRLRALEETSAAIREGVHGLQLQLAVLTSKNTEKILDDCAKDIKTLQSDSDKAKGALRILYALWVVLAGALTGWIIYALTHLRSGQ
jgi:chromosome segregation ATPase